MVGRRRDAVRGRSIPDREPRRGHERVRAFGGRLDHAERRRRERFLTLTRLRVESSEALVAAELERSHVRLVAEAAERWDPWIGRGLAAAGAFGVLAVVTTLGLALARVLRRRRAARPAKAPPIPRASRDAAPATAEAPAYLLPGFQDEVQARRRVEEELEATTRERDQLAERCRRLVAELDEARGRGDGPAIHRSAVAQR